MVQDWSTSAFQQEAVFQGVTAGLQINKVNRHGAMQSEVLWLAFVMPMKTSSEVTFVPATMSHWLPGTYSCFVLIGLWMAH